MALYDYLTLGDSRFDSAADTAEFVFVLIGTSNMGGTNSVEHEPQADTPSATTNVWVCDKWVTSAKRATFVANDPAPGWTRLTESMGLTPGTWGPEVMLGLELERRINYAMAGWKPTDRTPAPIAIRLIKLGISFGVLHSTGTSPLLEFNDADSGASNTAHKLLSDHYLKEYINEVRTRTSGACYFGGFFSVLGETDTLAAPAGTASSHTDAEANIIDLHNVLHDRIDVPMAPWVASIPHTALPPVARINSSYQFDPTRVAAVRTGLGNFASRAQYERWIELVDPSDLLLIGTSASNDGLHLTGSAQHEMGRRMAAAWHKIASKNQIYRVLADLP